jgi:hypothetical protein
MVGNCAPVGRMGDTEREGSEVMRWSDGMGGRGGSESLMMKETKASLFLPLWESFTHLACRDARPAETEVGGWL